MAIDYDDMMQSGSDGLVSSYDEKDVMLYALGVGFMRDPLDENELPFAYENGLKVVPTFASVIARGEAPPERQRMPQKSSINFMLLVDGERRITFHKPLPPRADLIADERTVDIYDKGEGKGAVLVQERTVRERASNEKLCTITASYFLRGDGGFGGPGHVQPEPHAIPDRAPDLVKECDTRPDQAFLYALSGDRNPLHRDPKVAKLVGFPRPILHGLCSYGTACRAILSTVARYQPENIRQFDVRFSKPVFPGETLVTEIWVDGKNISFRATVKERPGVVVLNKRALRSVVMEDPIEAAQALIAAGDAHQAARDLRARLADGRGGALARVTLVQALLASNDVPGALAEAREAVSLNPDLPEVLVALGEALLAAENLPAAIAELQRALRLDPDHVRARSLTGQTWLEAGEADKALEIFRGLDADAPGLAAAIARAETIRNAPRSDAGYVRHLFDQFSADYDQRMLGQLGYAAPHILAELADLVMAGREGLNILDLGCGTGLAGMAFKSRAARLDGIDLSPAMIEKARARGIYDSLQVADLETALAAPGPAHDLILAADTMVYLGDLSAVFAATAKRLAPDGYFLFTLEKAEGRPFELGPKRRWRHSEAYVRDLAGQSGLGVAGLVDAAPRSEAGKAVPGLAVALFRL